MYKASLVPVFKDIIVSVETPQVSSRFPLVLVVMRDTCSCLQNNLKNLLIPVKQGRQETLLFCCRWLHQCKKCKKCQHLLRIISVQNDINHTFQILLPTDWCTISITAFIHKDIIYCNGLSSVYPHVQTYIFTPCFSLSISLKCSRALAPCTSFHSVLTLLVLTGWSMALLLASVIPDLF